MWVYYVNRGQAVACFGIRNKDHGIMPFQSASLHLARVEQEGFRTLVRWRDDDAVHFHEPFRAAVDADRTMTVTPSDLTLEERGGAELDFRVTYTTVPGENCPALLRSVTITNRSQASRDLEVLDGFPRLVPYGLDHFASQNAPFICQGYLHIDGLELGLPFYRFLDAPSYRHVIPRRDAGHFYYAFADGTADPLPVVVDGDRVFGEGGSWAVPVPFARGDELALETQKTACMTASAFACWKGALNQGDSVTLHSLCGSADSFEVALGFRQRAMTAGWVEKKRSEATIEVDKVRHRFFIHCADEGLNGYIPQTFLDNVLRGGLPVTLEAEGREFHLHVFNRVHGDLERDYNRFSLAPTYFSQGNGHYRDVNQNRRNDLWFNPRIGAVNLRYFFNLLRLDGYNPMECLGVVFRLDGGVTAADMAAGAGVAAPDQRLLCLLADDYTPGDLLDALESAGIEREELPRALDAILSHSTTREKAEFETGFWIDHWFYCFDHLDRFAALFPDQLGSVLVHDRSYTYWDDEHRVPSRGERYLLVGDNLVHQVGMPVVDPNKRALLEKRVDGRNLVRDRNGTGQVYTANLLEKIICLFLNKAATVAPSGAGIEMEAGHPGWHDSINRLPYRFGSSTSELFQLLRAVRMVERLLAGLSVPAQVWPREMVVFMEQVDHALAAHAGAPAAYWGAVNDAKEAFRRDTWMGLSGETRTVNAGAIHAFLERLKALLERLVAAVSDPATGLPATYYLHRPEAWEVRTDGEGGVLRSAEGYPLVTIRSFTAEPLPLFLEAPVHALRIADQPGAGRICEGLRASPLYDRALKMYLLGDDLSAYGSSIGRIGVWTPGWFENENVFLHMEHKLLLAMFESGQHERLFETMRDVMVPFQPPERYGRSPIENTSFIVSSRHPFPERHGRGYLPRSSGTTAEVLDLFLRLSFGDRPFRMEEGELVFELSPCLPGWLFTAKPAERTWIMPDGTEKQVHIDRNCYTALLLGHTLVTYHNPGRADLFGRDRPKVRHYRLTDERGAVQEIEGDTIRGDAARRVRDGVYSRIAVDIR